jgi:lysophospholipase L1-like esterase
MLRRNNALRFVAISLALVGAVQVAPVLPARAADRIDVYPLGDSITFGYTPSTNTPGGYRGVLDAALTQAEVPHRFVGTTTANPSVTLTATDQARHDGHNGYRIDQVAADLDGVAGAYDDRGGHWLTGTATRPAIDPDIVLVHLGTNDIAKRFDPANVYDDPEPLDEPDERARFVASMTDRLEALVDKVLALRPDSIVVVSTVIPLATGGVVDAVPAEYASAVRDRIRAHPQYGTHVRLVDAYAAFVDDAGRPIAGLLSGDGCHPTAAGYAVLGRTFAAAVDG